MHTNATTRKGGGEKILEPPFHTPQAAAPECPRKVSTKVDPASEGDGCGGLYSPSQALEFAFARRRDCALHASAFSGLPRHILSTLACKARPKEKLSFQGCPPLAAYLSFAAKFSSFKFTVACSSVSPPLRKKTPARSSVRHSSKTSRVARATSCADAFSELSDPAPRGPRERPRADVGIGRPSGSRARRGRAGVEGATSPHLA